MEHFNELLIPVEKGNPVHGHTSHGRCSVGSSFRLWLTRQWGTHVVAGPGALTWHRPARSNSMRQPVGQDSRQLGLREAQVPGRTALTHIAWRNVPRGEVTWVGVWGHCRFSPGEQAEQMWSPGRCAWRGLVSPGGLSAGLPGSRGGSEERVREGEERGRE